MKLNIIVIFLLITGSVFAQEKTLLSSNITSTGWFGAPVIKYTSLNEKGSVIVGARGGYIINHALIVGAGMYRLVSNVELSASQNTYPINYDDNLHLMYGGLELGYVINPMELFHYTFNTLLGVGNVSNNNIDGFNENGSDHHTGKSFFVIEPSGAIETNITNYLRLEIGLSYRLSTGLNYTYISNKDLSSFNGFLSLKFGAF